MSRPPHGGTGAATIHFHNEDTLGNCGFLRHDLPTEVQVLRLSFFSYFIVSKIGTSRPPHGGTGAATDLCLHHAGSGNTFCHDLPTEVQVLRLHRVSRVWVRPAIHCHDLPTEVQVLRLIFKAPDILSRLVTTSPRRYRCCDKYLVLLYLYSLYLSHDLPTEVQVLRQSSYIPPLSKVAPSHDLPTEVQVLRHS